MYRKDRGSLLAVLDSINKILEYVKGLSSAKDYFQSQIVFDATLMNFITIGEMVDRISSKLKAEHAGVDWQRVKDFRNLVAHDYLGIDAEEVWQIIKNDLPSLRDSVSKILYSLSSDQ